MKKIKEIYLLFLFSVTVSCFFSKYFYFQDCPFISVLTLKQFFQLVSNLFPFHHYTF